MEFMFLSMITEKLRVLIIGGGNAGLIKAKSFINRGCSVTVASKKFNEDLQDLAVSGSLTLISDGYSPQLIKSFHLVVIAVSEPELINRIIEDCNREAKLFLNCRNFKEGMFVMPTHRNTEHASFALNTKGGNPKTAKYVGDKLEEKLRELDSFIGFATTLRENLKDNVLKDEVMAFVATEDFRCFYEEGIHEKVLCMFYGEKLKKLRFK